MTIAELYSSMNSKQRSSIEELMDLELSNDEKEFRMMTEIFKGRQWQIVYVGKKKTLTSCGFKAYISKYPFLSQYQK